jgi:hypothetical protein
MEASDGQLLDDDFVYGEDGGGRFLLHGFGKDVIGVIILEHKEMGVACAGRNDEPSGLVGKCFVCLVGVGDRRICMMSSATGWGRAWENISGRFGSDWSGLLRLRGLKIFSGLVHVAHGGGDGFCWVFADEFGSESRKPVTWFMSSAVQSVERAEENRAAFAKATSPAREAEMLATLAKASVGCERLCKAAM